MKLFEKPAVGPKKPVAEEEVAGGRAETGDARDERIRELEAENRELKAENQQLRDLLRFVQNLTDKMQDRIHTLREERDELRRTITLANGLVDALLTNDRRAQSEKMTDTLTGLPNELGLRNELLKILNLVSSGGRRRKEGETPVRPFTLLFIDANGFKKVNDTYGHKAGDRILEKVAEFLKNIAQREGDVVSRLHGDEFAVVFDGVAPAEAIARFEQTESGEPFDLEIELEGVKNIHTGETETAVVSLSCGVTQLKPGDNVDAALDRADAAMYAAKGFKKDYPAGYMVEYKEGMVKPKEKEGAIEIMPEPEETPA